MKYTRYSLFYPASVLFVAGSGFLFAPTLTLDLLRASGSYSEVFVRLTGVFLLVVSGFVIQTIRHQFVPMYIWTIFLRLFIGANLIWFYSQTSDRLFLVIFAILAIGIGLTILGLWLDRKIHLYNLFNR